MQLRIVLDASLFELTSALHFSALQWPVWDSALFQPVANGRSAASNSTLLGLEKYCDKLHMNPRALFLNTLTGTVAASILVSSLAAVGSLVAVYFSRLQASSVGYVSSGFALRVLVLGLYPVVSTACFQLSLTLTADAPQFIDWLLSCMAGICLCGLLCLLAWVSKLVALHRKEDSPLSRYSLSLLHDIFINLCN